MKLTFNDLSKRCLVKIAEAANLGGVITEKDIARMVIANKGAEYTRLYKTLPDMKKRIRKARSRKVKGEAVEAYNRAVKRFVKLGDEIMAINKQYNLGIMEGNDGEKVHCEGGCHDQGRTQGAV